MKNIEFILKRIQSNQAIVDEKIERALNIWLEAGKAFDSSYTLEKVSQEFNVDKTQLNHYFSVKYGTSFLKWRRRLRMVQAAELIARNPELPLSEIAKCVGVPDKTNFKRQFTIEIGLSPQEWKESL